MLLGFTADLHWGSHRSGDQATRQMLAFLMERPPDVLVLAGDVGTAQHFAECLALFDGLSCRKALVPGNHDIWVEENDRRGNSLEVYRTCLPQISRERGFHYLDHEPLFIPDTELALVGSINWYDYSWSLPELQRLVPDWEERLRAKRFTRGRHNDGRFIRWPLDDGRFATEIVAQLELHLEDAAVANRQVIVVTHHPPFYGLNFPRSGPPSVPDGLLWDALCGNHALEKVLTRHAGRVLFAFCGHTHRERENVLGPIRGYNIGGDYHYKALLLLDWPAGAVTAHVFGEP